MWKVCGHLIILVHSNEVRIMSFGISDNLILKKVRSNGDIAIVKTQRNSTQRNSKATSVGVRHSSQVFHPPHPPPTPLPQTFQPLLDQLES